MNKDKNTEVRPAIAGRGSVVVLDCLQGGSRDYMPREEKRYGRRSTCQEPVKVENCETGEIISGNMYNFSITGFYFETDATMIEGTEIRLFSAHDNLDPALYNVRGKVRWYQEISGAVVLHAYGYGVEYDRPLAENGKKRRFKVIEGGISERGNARPKKTAPNSD